MRNNISYKCLLIVRSKGLKWTALDLFFIQSVTVLMGLVIPTRWQAIFMRIMEKAPIVSPRILLPPHHKIRVGYPRIGSLVVFLFLSLVRKDDEAREDQDRETNQAKPFELLILANVIGIEAAKVFYRRDPWPEDTHGAGRSGTNRGNIPYGRTANPWWLFQNISFDWVISCW